MLNVDVAAFGGGTQGRGGSVGAGVGADGDGDGGVMARGLVRKSKSVLTKSCAKENNR